MDENGFTSFIDELLNGNTDLSNILQSKTVKTYIMQLKRNSKTIRDTKAQTFSLEG